MEEKDFKNLLIRYRKAKGLTQKEVAELCKITIRTIQRIENGQVKPRVHTIKVISENLSIPFFETSTKTNTNKAIQFYSLKELFNFKEKAMQKISVLTVPILIISTAIYFFSNFKANAQNNIVKHPINCFSIDLYQKEKVDNENLLISPLSTYYSLLMAYEGAEKQTKQEFEKVLYLNDTKNRKLSFLDSITNRLKNTKSITLSNAIWLDNTIVPEGKYINTINKKYIADVKRVDFSVTNKAKDSINKWFFNKTNKNIKNIVKNINPETKTIITNAIYFKGEWLMKFNKELTKPAVFFSEKEEQYKVDLMNLTESVKYFENKELQFIAKPYKNTDLSFCVILPKKLFGLKKVESKLSSNFLTQLLDSANYTKTNIYLPKIKIDKTIKLKESLKKLGLKNAFSKKADFSGIIKNNNIQLTEIVHKTYIIIDEEKTKAAAASVTNIYITGNLKKSKTKLFKANHPFIFFIVNNTTKKIVFIGKYFKPENAEKIATKDMEENIKDRNNELSLYGKEPLIFVDGKLKPIKDVDFNNVESLKVLRDIDEIKQYTYIDNGGLIIITTKSNSKKKKKYKMNKKDSIVKKTLQNGLPPLKAVNSFEKSKP